MDDTKVRSLPGKSSTSTSVTVRFGLFLLGSTLMIAAPIAGLLPGPGGIFVFAIGLGLALKNSAWAKRRYVEFKRRFPKPAKWADWGMRRASHLRRTEVAKARDSGRNG
jgi:hypothetical protein